MVISGAWWRVWHSSRYHFYPAPSRAEREPPRTACGRFTVSQRYPRGGIPARDLRPEILCQGCQEAVRQVEEQDGL